MSIASGIVVYLILFWTVLFTVLPWGNKPDERKNTADMGGAPANPRIKQKFMVTAIISAIIWGIVFALIHFEVIDFYAIARQMTEEDYGS